MSPASNLLDLENGLNSSDALTATPPSDNAIQEGKILESLQFHILNYNLETFSTPRAKPTPTAVPIRMMLETNPPATQSTSITVTETSTATTLSTLPEVQSASLTAQIASTAQTASTSTVATPQVQPTVQEVQEVPTVQAAPVVSAAPAASNENDNIEADSTPIQKGNLYFRNNYHKLKLLQSLFLPFFSLRIIFRKKTKVQNRFIDGRMPTTSW